MKKVKFVEVNAQREAEEDYRLEQGVGGKWFLVLARGECRSGGHDIRLIDVELDNGVVTATVEKINPEPGAFVTMAITFPVRKYELDLHESPKEIRFKVL